MLAATRARPPATLVPHPGRGGFAASLAAQGCGAFADDPLTAAGGGRGRRVAPPARGGSPARPALSWPHAAPMSWPRLRRIVVEIPLARRRDANRSITS